MTERNFYLEDIPLEEARQRLEIALREIGHWESLSGEMVALINALGRITAEPVWAKRSSPHYHAAAMDGYAVYATDTLNATETRPITLNLDTQAIAVNTGDPLPITANAVIMIENVQHINHNQIEIRAAVPSWQHVRMVGEDIVSSELVLPINHRIRPVDLGAIAGCGHHEVNVRRQPNIIIIPTGSELISTSEIPKVGQITEYNSLVLRGQILEAGGQATITEIIPDDLSQLQIALQKAISKNPDLILILSGSSAGSKDFTATLLQNSGELLVHGVAARPGHPVIIGIVNNIPVIGVPGYPVSAALTGELFIQPLIAQWLGTSSNIKNRPHIQASMTRKLLSPTGDDDFVRVTLAQVGDRLLAAPLSRGAGIITSLVRADGLAHIPRFSEGVYMGKPVNVILYRSLDEIQRTIMALGSHDPMLDLLGQFLATRHPDYRLTSANVGSIGGLIALRRQEAHIAGTHLLDPTTGNYNIPYIQQYLKNESIKLITFAHREQGLLVAKDNPHQIKSIEDLIRIRYVNRQRGAGTRVLLDYELEKIGINSDTIEGYQREEYTHLGVAAAIASGTADCGLAVRNAAIAMNLDFISVGWERYDLVIPNVYLELKGVQHLMSILQNPEFHAQLKSQPGYDTRETGIIQYET